MRVSLVLKKNLYKEVENRSKEEGKTVNKYIENILDDYLVSFLR